MKMPFGKYKDTDIFDVPQNYRLWILKNIDDDNHKELKDSIRHSLLYPDQRMPQNKSELEKIIRNTILKMIEEKI